MAPWGRLSEKRIPNKGILWSLCVNLCKEYHKTCVVAVELFEFTMGASKDDTVVQKEDAGRPREEFVNGGCGIRPSQRHLNGPGQSARLWDAHFCRQLPARRTGPYVLKESCRRLPEGRARWYF